MQEEVFHLKEKCFILIAHFNAVCLIAHGCGIGQVLRRAGTDCYFILFLSIIRFLLQ